MNKRIVIAVLLSMAFLLCSCGSERESAATKNETPIESKEKGTMKEFQIPDASAVSLTDAGVLYCRIADPDLDENGDLRNDTMCGPVSVEKGITEYFIYNPRNGKNQSIGVVEDQSYETVYARTEYGGKIYTLFMRGELLQDGNPLKLLEIDPHGGLKEYTVCENGFPYASMTEMEGKLVIAYHEPGEKGADIIAEFNPENGRIRELARYGSMKDGSEERIRAVCYDGRQGYLLSIRYTDQGNRMILTSFAPGFENPRTKDITDIFAEAVRTQNLTEEDAVNELIQHVAHFRINRDGILFYQNSSCVTFAANLQNDTVLLSGTDLLNVSEGNGTAFLYEILKGGEPESDKANRMFVPERENLREREFETEDSRYYISVASSAPHGEWLVVLEPCEERKGSAELPTLLCYWQEEKYYD
ncbi:MAG: hypothetical protein J5845_04945 [Lachnospiraceae bacterium]|nr:hypothetical protein [Lachnospiraceae bacterium]